MDTKEKVHEITPEETYQIDSSEYDSDEDHAGIEEEEYEELVQEAEDGFSEEEVKAMIHQLKEQGIINFLRSYLATGLDGQLASLRKLLLGFGIIPILRDRNVSNLALLPFTKIALSRILRRRTKLTQYNTVQDAIHLLRTSRRIIVLSGAGISTSCGIPDFRSANGLYATLQQEGKYDLDDPHQMFDIRYFVEHPEVFYSFAKQIYPSNFVPSPCHRWIKLLEDRGQLLRNYTQNIDTLESLAGVEKVLQCHGSFKTASCLRCRHRVPGQTIEPYIMSSSIPYCGECRQRREAEIAAKKAIKEGKRKDKGKGRANGWGSGSDESEEEDEWAGGLPGIMKPDITFFGQALDSEFDQCLFQDREEVDLLIIIGTSLKVAPVSEVLTHIPHSVPQIFINLTPISHVQPDICLLGDADSIVTYLSEQLDWTIPPPAAVSQPANGDISPPPNGAETKAPAVPPLKVSPGKVKWNSGVGDMSHIHFLASTEDPVDEAQHSNGDVKRGSPESTIEVPGIPVVPIERSGRPQGDDDQSLDERPPKRARPE